jgi:hypothetical protein
MHLTENWRRFTREVRTSGSCAWAPTVSSKFRLTVAYCCLEPLARSGNLSQRFVGGMHGSAIGAATSATRTVAQTSRPFSWSFLAPGFFVRMSAVEYVRAPSSTTHTRHHANSPAGATRQRVNARALGHLGYFHTCSHAGADWKCCVAVRACVRACARACLCVCVCT